MMDRRRFLAGLAAGGLLAGHVQGAARRAGKVAFLHGVASGDPGPESIVLWTRVSPERADREVPVAWRLSDRDDFSRTVQSGRVVAGPQRDHTVKVIVSGLEPGRTWYYRFEADGEGSAVGRTRTLPVASPGSLELAVVSCSNYPAGYFNVYADVAAAPGLAAVVHLGDYLYEYAMGEYGTNHAEALGRVPDPEYETLTLDDYRRRHAQYKTDPSSQAMHARLPLIPIWDDHELANDAWMGGAENHQAGEGDWETRRAAALRAYEEWMPVTPFDAMPPQRYRRFPFGDLADLLLLDTRVAGRTQQASSPRSADDVDRLRAELASPGRELLGGAQERWLAERIRESRASWQLLAQQVMVAPMRSPDLHGVIDLDAPGGMPRERLEGIVAQSRLGMPMLLDTWDGYPLARERFFDLMREASAPIVLSGDLHASVHGDLVDPRDGRRIAPEFVTPAVSSPGLGASLPPREPGGVERAILAENPHVRYLDIHANGWLHLHLDPRGVTAEWRHVSTVLEPGFRVSRAYRTEIAAT